MEYRLSHWAAVMRERTASGMSIKAFCKHIGICANTYFYWQRRLRAATTAQMELGFAVNSAKAVRGFSEVSILETVAEPNFSEECHEGHLKIEIGDIKITVDSAYPADKLAILIRELARSC